MKENAEKFLDVLEAIANANKESDSGQQGYDDFFAELFKDPGTLDGCIVFISEFLERLSVSELKCAAVRIAQFLQANMPTTRRYFTDRTVVKRDQREVWERQLRMLNWQFVMVTKLAIFLIERQPNQKATISRAQLDGINEQHLRSTYKAELDALEFFVAGEHTAETYEQEMARRQEVGEDWRKRFNAEKTKSPRQAWVEAQIEMKEEQQQITQAKLREMQKTSEPVKPKEPIDPTRLDLID